MTCYLTTLCTFVYICIHPLKCYVKDSYQGTGIHIKVPVFISRYRYSYQGTCIHIKVPVFISRYRYSYQGTGIHIKVLVFMICQ